MEQVLAKLLNQSIKHLTALENRGDIKFKIFTSEGLEYGKLKVAKPKPEKKKRVFLHPHGEIRQYLLPILEGVKHDQVVSIPVGKYEIETIRGNACSWCTTAWGKGMYSSTVNKDKNCVELYRFPK